MKKKNKALVIIAVVLLLLVFIASLFLDRDRSLEDETYSPTADKYTAPNTIVLKGQTYVQNKDLTTVLFIGVDNYGPVEESEVFYNEGQADFLLLAIFDKNSKTVSLLHINRDTMTPVTMLGLGGKKAGTAEMQIALAHCYGKGVQDSCKNTLYAVENFLQGTDIDHYFAMNMDGVALLNDEVGGVTVTIEDEFRDNPEFVVGETITLKGNQALAYVRGRTSVADGSNLNRMKRQRDYIRKFIDNYDKQSQSVGFVETSITLVSDYCVTDMPLEKLSEIAGLFSEYALGEVYSIEGTLSYANEFVEFYADNAALTEQLSQLLYIPKIEEQ